MLKINLKKCSDVGIRKDSISELYVYIMIYAVVVKNS
jgi:hypothetical protein